MAASFGSRNGCLVTRNITFDYTTDPQPGDPSIINADGQLLIGSIETTPNIAMSAGNLVSPNASVTIGYSYPNITIDLPGGGQSIQRLTGNSGVATPVSNNINVVTANSSVNFVGTSGNLTLDFGLSNIALGSSLPSLTAGTNNVGIGDAVFDTLTSGTYNTFVGHNVSGGSGVTEGNQNCGMGVNALVSLTSGSNNVAVGYLACNLITTGTNNICLGNAAGGSLTSGNSSNIAIGNSGVNGDNNAIRLGTQGSSAGQQNKCYIAGITGVTTTSSKLVTINSSTTEMGVGIDYNGVASNLNLGTLMSSRTSGDNNVSVGRTALSSVTSGLRNVSLGNGAGIGNSTGSDNVCVGHNAMFLSTSPEQNVAIGNSSLFSLTTGENNIGIGYIAGSALTSSESSNILIGNVGVVGESNTIRIGTQGTGAAQQSNCYLAGVLRTTSGRTVNVTTPGAYPYTTLTTDYVILVDTSSARTITPLASPATGTTYRIKDNVGSAGSNNITITPSGKNIDGAASYVVNTNYGSVDITYTGAEWSVL